MCEINGYVDLTLPCSYSHDKFRAACSIALTMDDFRYFYTTYWAKDSNSLIRLKIGRAFGEETGTLWISYITVG